MAFATESEAKQFLIERIAARASAEGRPLSDQELVLLGFSEAAADLTSDSEGFLDPDDCEEDFEARMAHLLRQSYEADEAAGVDVRTLYPDALSALGGGDHYLTWVARVAGLGPPMPKWLRLVKQLGLVVLLVIPALVALLIAAAGLWAAIGQPSHSTRDTVGMSVVALVFAGFGTFLFALYVRECRD
jgi:hypothetical protein